MLRVNLQVSAFASVLSAKCDEMFQLLETWGKLVKSECSLTLVAHFCPFAVKEGASDSLTVCLLIMEQLSRQSSENCNSC